MVGQINFQKWTLYLSRCNLALVVSPLCISGSEKLHYSVVVSLLLLTHQVRLYFQRVPLVLCHSKFLDTTCSHDPQLHCLNSIDPTKTPPPKVAFRDHKKAESERGAPIDHKQEKHGLRSRTILEFISIYENGSF